MEKSLKVLSEPSERDDVADDMLKSHSEQRQKIKVNDLEKYLFKAFERREIPSFHEAIGPALTGFVYRIRSHVEN